MTIRFLKWMYIVSKSLMTIKFLKWMYIVSKSLMTIRFLKWMYIVRRRRLNSLNGYASSKLIV